MQAFTQHQGLVVPLDRANVDTDLIIPKQFLKSIKRTGFGPNLFDQLRYLDEGQPGMDNSSRPKNKDFVLNQERYKKATVLLAKENFGCGSSREHAPWALLDYGFRVVLAPSFADIFYNNCFKNGMLPIVLQDNVINELFEDVEMNEGYSLAIDLQEEQITKPGGRIIEFIVEPFRKHCLINGLDDIGLTLEKSAKIKMFETDRVQLVPWMFS